MDAHETPMTVTRFTAMKSAGQKITMLTAYDYTMARLLDEAGVDGLLVGDSLAMVVQGHPTTLPATMEQMLYHAEMVGRAVRRALVVVDMPFMSYQLGVRDALANAGRILKQTRCQAVKLEGGADQAEIVAALVRAGIPVMAHLGLRPQSVHQSGGYSVQRNRQQLLQDSQAVQQAGAFSILLECIPADLAAEITASVQVPTIGIGAGSGCDGQIQVIHDVVGLTLGRLPRHAKTYADLKTAIQQAVAQYCQEVRQGLFPSAEHSFR
ncbi:MAG TPA: 3-methyl-2-oxobutanoate hydroxymethyltransferase [Thermoguttaceae bacterium]|nr:3-methyl-2-oxobutanoate hydroxymethyltransferase [Thermoguttaceae bacterium]HPP51375.1 3-methyl-2-oxobutanoate hydroxymethyltransferase [Thermoguttaceae bacterium]